MTRKNAKWEWTQTHQRAFDSIKQIVAKNTLLCFPGFTWSFDVHTDAFNIQLGGVVSQDNLPLAYFSQKLNPAQHHYTTTEQELLAITETLRQFCTMLLVQ